ncbi:MAG: universal stress protein, partial [Actinomycetota bacterium]|nr:universal stress protein [Actinomycetota bacterium]
MGTELNRILLAADGSGVASRVAADLARWTGAELHVVRAWSADLPGAYALTMPSVRARWHEQKAGETISEDVERIEETGATVAVRGGPTIASTAATPLVTPNVSLRHVGERRLPTAMLLPHDSPRD